MVSNASEDLPDPDRPVITTRLSRGISTSTFFRLCSRAPRTWMEPAIDRRFPGAVVVFLCCSPYMARNGPLGKPGPAIWLDQGTGVMLALPRLGKQQEKSSWLAA